MDVRFIAFALSICFLTIIRESSSNCTRDIPHGEVKRRCRTFTGRTCSYLCDEGYEKNEDTYWISCSSSGEWRPITLWTTGSKDLCLPKSCPGTIPNGKLSESCGVKVGTTCEYSCNTGYQKNTTVPTITCEPSTNWNSDPHSLCNSNQQCPYEVKHGDLDLSCQRVRGESCNFTCSEGYIPSQTLSSSTITCQSSLVWSQPLSSLCEKIICPLEIPNGAISTACSRQYKAYCDEFHCNTGYSTPADEPSVRCNASGQWHWSKYSGDPCARTDELCPSTIKNGKIVWYCHRQHGVRCTYSCNSGCTKDRSISRLNCGKNSKWDKNTDTLCTCEYVEATSTPSVSTATTSTTTVPSTSSSTVTTTATSIPNICPNTVPDGLIDPECHRWPFVTCSYTCNGGCDNTYRSLYCTGQGYWYNEETACMCYGAPETTAHASVAATSTSTITSFPYLCPDTIPNGHIDSECNRRPYSVCRFVCDDGCIANFITLKCTSRSYWNNGKSACRCNDEHVTSTTSDPSHIPDLCTYYIPNGHVSSTCSRALYSNCYDYTCYSGCHKMVFSLHCTGFGNWSSGRKACSCQSTNSPPTPNSLEGFNSTPVIIGVVIAVVAIAVASVVCYIWFKKTRQQSQPSIYCQPSMYYNRPELTRTNINNGTRNHSITPVSMLQNQTHVYTPIQQQGNTEENPYIQLQPPIDELNARISEHPEYGNVTEFEPEDDPSPYELVFSNPSYFKG